MSFFPPLPPFLSRVSFEQDGRYGTDTIGIERILFNGTWRKQPKEAPSTRFSKVRSLLLLLSHSPSSADIFVNCIYLTSKIPSFVSPESIALAGAFRNLRVVVDVSCDTTNPNNPIPIYDINTTFDRPTVDVPAYVFPSPSLASAGIELIKGIESPKDPH